MNVGPNANGLAQIMLLYIHSSSGLKGNAINTVEESSRAVRELGSTEEAL